MSKLRAEFKLNEAEMKNNGASVESLEKKHDLLEQQLSAAKDKTEALSGKVEAATRIFGENSDEVTKLKTQLANAQTAEEKIRGAINDCNAELQRQADAADETENATENLTDKIERQQTELKQLKTDYVNAVAEFGEASDEAKDLESQIENLSGELKQSKDAFDDAASKADKLDQSMNDAGDAARDSGDGFTVAKGAIADLASEAIQLGIEKISEFIGWLAELPEATRELRQDMSTLETSFETAGFTTEQATNTWKELYSVFGEDDRAVEAANLIAKMADNQQNLSDWVTITQGVWGQYQDSLPVEGLAEASMETAKTGTVTGVLADALNWSSEAASMFAGYMGGDVVTAEDAFNVALSECSTEQERQALITETLTALYGDAATKYEEASGQQIAAKEATAENTLAQAELADAIEPVTTAWEGLKTSLITAVIPAVEAVSGVFVDALGWMKEHPVAMQAIAAAVGVLAIGFTGLAIAMGVYAAAQWAANLALAPFALPVLAIVAAVAALAAIVVVVINYWDEIKAAISNACSACITALQNAWAWVQTVFSTIATWIDTNVIQPVVNFFTGLWQSIVNIWQSISNAIQVAIMFIGSILSAAFQIITLPFRLIWENCKNTVISAWSSIQNAVSTAINSVKNIVVNVTTSIKTQLPIFGIR